MFTVFLLAQAGVPFTAGFLAKFYVISAAVEAHSYALAIIAMLAAVIAAFFYLRVIVAMYMSSPEEEAAAMARAEAAHPGRGRSRPRPGRRLHPARGFLPEWAFDFARNATVLRL